MPPIPICIPLHDELSQATPQLSILPRRKALLIGINYKSAEQKDYMILATPQRDVEDFKKLLIEVYHYKVEDIVAMTDRPGVKPHLLPTRANILREITRFVGGAQDGDSFVFLYSGHSDQVDNTTGTEDDMKDEVILPLDHEGTDRPETFIRDNDLKKYLVNPLPVGARLTALFDSCHSGTLLDLKHYKCNSFGNGITRMPLRSGTARSPAESGSVEASVRIYKLSEGETRIKKKSIEVYQKAVAASGSLAQSVLVNNASRSNEPSRAGSLHIDDSPVRSRTQPLPSLSMGEAAILLDRPTEEKENHHSWSLPPLDTAPVDDWSREWCSSPVPDSSMAHEDCDGNCLASPTLRPTVISVAACGDSQQTYEDIQGEASSLIQAIIAVLRRSPQPSLEDFMQDIGELLKQAAHRRVKGFREARAIYGPEYDLANPRDALLFEQDLKRQVPQFGSHKPLNRNQPFTL